MKARQLSQVGTDSRFTAGQADAGNSGGFGKLFQDCQGLGCRHQFLQIVHPDDSEFFKESIKDLIASRQASGVGGRQGLSLFRPSGLQHHDGFADFGCFLQGFHQLLRVLAAFHVKGNDLSIRIFYQKLQIIFDGGDFSITGRNGIRETDAGGFHHG